ncbi:MAG TPA: Ig-like domain-containing protein [Vicinamibacteria bacterium]|nr:Ig-like domain-containing protein [Vicinamibacteria bacterium]
MRFRGWVLAIPVSVTTLPEPEVSVRGTILNGPSSLVLEGEVVEDNRFYLACETITIGPDFHIVGPGSAVFRAGSHVTVWNGFSVGSDARATFQLDPGCTADTLPTVTIDAPVDGSIFGSADPIDFSGAATDDEDGDLASELSWISDRDGSIGSGAVISTAGLSPGLHRVTAWVADHGGLIGSAQIALTVVVGSPPSVTINAPASGSIFDSGESIDFTGTASDAEDGVLTAEISWSSNLDGEFGTGGSITHGTLSLGQHTITATVTDTEGLASSDLVTLTVNNTPPVVSISLPVHGASFDFGETIQFSGTADDLEDGELTPSLLWESDRDGSLGTGGFLSMATLSSGSHEITASAVDGEGSTGLAQVNVAVAEPAPTTVEVRVGSSSDDAEEKPTGSVSLASSDLELVEEGSIQTVGIRFGGVDVPRDAAIANAFIQFQVDETGDGPTFLVIEGESVDHAFPFATSNGDVSTRPRTAASVVWVPPPWTTVGESGSEQRTPDLSPVIQEIVSRPGWSSGNALSIVLIGVGRRTAEAYDGVQNAAPLLHIEYRDAINNAPPTVTIAAPENGTTFENGLNVVFLGTATDAEDGDVSSLVSWESDRDGMIGAGGSFTSDLSEGVHVVTATATDTGGKSGSDQVLFVVLPTGVVVVGAGDIAGCGPQNDEGTAALLDDIAGTVITLGDHVYPDGAAQEFANCYDPSWGRHKWRTQPSAGNHDYHTAGASAYFDYFGAAAGNPGEGYYSYDLGSWHVIVLNSNCAQVGGCDPGSPQGQWLQSDLAANPSTCTLAYWHHPRFSSGEHGNAAAAVDLFEMAYQGGIDVVLTAHDHDYERFAPQDPNGNLDQTRGVRQFVVGTGGAALRPMVTVLPNSQVRHSDSHGVLKLTLYPAGYEWEFVTVSGTFTDSGAAACVATP